MLGDARIATAEGRPMFGSSHPHHGMTMRSAQRRYSACGHSKSAVELQIGLSVLPHERLTQLAVRARSSRFRARGCDGFLPFDADAGA
jgi:hypothetical protein